MAKQRGASDQDEDEAEYTGTAPRYRVLVPSFIDDSLQPPDKEITFNGIPGSNLMPLNDAAKERVAKAPAEMEAAMKALVAATQPIGSTSGADIAAGVVTALISAGYISKPPQIQPQTQAQKAA